MAAPHLSKPFEGFNEDPYDTTLAVVRYGGIGIKKLILTFDSGRDVRRGTITAQSIFLTNLWLYCTCTINLF